MFFFRRAQNCEKSFFANGPAKKNHSRPVGPAKIFSKMRKIIFRKWPRKKNMHGRPEPARASKMRKKNIHGRPGHHHRNPEKIVEITRGFGGEIQKFPGFWRGCEKKNIHGPSDWVPAKVEMRKMIFRIGPRKKKHARPPRLLACVKKNIHGHPHLVRA